MDVRPSFDITKYTNIGYTLQEQNYFVGISQRNIPSLIEILWVSR